MGNVATGLLVLAGAVVTIDAAVRVMTTVFGRTVGHRARSRRLLRKLAPNETGRYFESLLGVPTVERRCDERLHERIWADRLYFVQAFTESDDRVVVYSVTARSRGFRLHVPFPGGGSYWGNQQQPLSAVLGRSSFADVGADPSSTTGSLGAHRWWYSEVYAFGNPSNYQSLVLSINDGAETSGDVTALLDGIREAQSGWDESEPLVLQPSAVARLKACPNTYSVTAPHFDLHAVEAVGGLFGADMDAVRVLPVWDTDRSPRRFSRAFKLGRTRQS